MRASLLVTGSLIVAFASVGGCAKGMSEEAGVDESGSGGAASSAGGTSGGGTSGASTAGASGANAGAAPGGGGGASAGTSSGGAKPSGGTSSGGTSSGGTSSGGTSSGGTSAGGTSACAGVTCATPPPNSCADASTLSVPSPTGSCQNGQCTYPATMVPCSMGCQNGQCVGDPCAGVTCATPPKSTCTDSMHLQVNDAPGTCANGTCSYPSHVAFCSFGCTNDVCDGDPCTGMSCTTPPVSYCADASHLVVYDTPGTCTNGACGYGNHQQFCDFGCVNDACMGDPCAGMTCTKPPASYCVDASTLRTFSASGTCTAGTCNYPMADMACSHGCSGGVCKDCSADADCPSGKYCNGGSCTSCNVDQHCGASCTDCSAAGEVCDPGQSTCVACLADSNCAPGTYCSNGTCAACNVDAHCGSTCGACSGSTPTCSNGACACTASSCGPNTQCTGGACVVCASDSACGASCSPCSGATPHCLASGNASSCVQCLSDGDCPAGVACNGGTCGCALPSSACTTDSGASGDGCAQARTIGRAAALGTYTASDSTCSNGDNFYSNSSSCWDANTDFAYRIFLRAGESIAAHASTGTNCPSSQSWPGSWAASLEVWTPSSSTCGDMTCANRVACKSDSWSPSVNYTAPSDGWYVIVVDGASAFDDWGDYDFTLTLTGCATANCGCP